jgi:hypothetical protein
MYTYFRASAVGELLSSSLERPSFDACTCEERWRLQTAAGNIDDNVILFGQGCGSKIRKGGSSISVYHAFGHRRAHTLSAGSRVSEKWLSIGQVEIEMGADGQIRVERLKSQLSLDIFEAVRETGFIPVIRSDGEQTGKSRTNSDFKPVK